MSLALKISLSLDVILPESVSSRKKSKIKHLQLGFFLPIFCFSWEWCSLGTVVIGSRESGGRLT